MYETGTHRLIPTDTCAIENETAKKVTLAIRDIMARWNMEPLQRGHRRRLRAPRRGAWAIRAEKCSSPW